MATVVASVLYFVIVPYVLAYLVARITNEARFARVDRSEIPEEGSSELPSDDEPALIARVSEDGETGSRGLVATVIELERRGVVRIEHVRSSRFGPTLDEARKGVDDARLDWRERGAVELGFGCGTYEATLADDADAARLTKIEQRALDVVFAPGGRRVRAEQLAQWRADYPACARRLSQAFAQAVEELLVERHLVEGVSESFTDVVVMLVAIFYLAGLIVIGADSLLPLLLGAPGVVAALCFSRPREVFTPEGRELRVRCKTFGRYVSRSASVSGAHLTDGGVWGRSLAYGVAVGAVSGPVSELLPSTSSREVPRAPVWYVPYARLNGRGKGRPPVPPRKLR